MQTEVIRQRMAQMGLTEQALASRLALPTEAVGRWLAGGAIPRPRNLLALADVLGLTVDDLVGGLPLPAPVVTYHTEYSISAKAEEAVEQCARDLQCSFAREVRRPFKLLPFERTEFLDAQAQAAAGVTRAKLGARPGTGLTIAQLGSLFRDAKVTVVPTPGSAAPRFPVVTAIECAEDRASFLLVDLGAAANRVARGLARAYAHLLAGDKLHDMELERFCQRVSELLVPSAMPVGPTGVEFLTGETRPQPRYFIERCEEVFGTPIFWLLGEWQFRDGRRNPDFCSRVLCCDIGEALLLSGAIWERHTAAV